MEPASQPRKSSVAIPMQHFPAISLVAFLLLPIAGADFAYKPVGAEIPYEELNLEQPWEQFNLEHELMRKGIQKFVSDYKATLRKSR